MTLTDANNKGKDELIFISTSTSLRMGAFSPEMTSVASYITLTFPFFLSFSFTVLKNKFDESYTKV